MQVPISIKAAEAGQLHFIIKWADGTFNKFPYIFLRDNCPCCRHANGQKLIETSAISLFINPKSYIVDQESQTVVIIWEPDGHISEYSFEWLYTHSLRANDVEARCVAKNGENNIVLWRSQLNNGLPTYDYEIVKNNNAALAEWLTWVKQYGFGLLNNVPAQPGMVLQVANLFGYVRETNYGKLFDVKTVVNPNNLAYTGLGISPHTDNPYRQPVPTLQLLHCLSSTADGGDSILVDGFNVADDLRRQHPNYFSILNSTTVTFSFKDKDNWLERQARIIETDSKGRLRAINFNNRSIQPFEVIDDNMLDFYEAYLTFARMLEQQQYQIRFKMQSGDLYIVNNLRVLHARSAYTNNGGERWLQGAYADIDGLVSKWRILTQPQLQGFESF